MTVEPAESPDVVIGSDDVARCWWGAEPEIYRHYHDTEWGRPTLNERTLFEKLCLEGFQAGLSWLTILRKRPAFRECFAHFDPEVVAGYGESDIATLLGDERIIRHRGKIEATINNAQCLLAMHARGEDLTTLIWSFEDPHPNDLTSPGPTQRAQIPATTDASTALSKALKERGFRFVGPTTAYAALQAMGIVNDHLEGCDTRRPCAEARSTLSVPGSIGGRSAPPIDKDDPGT